MDAMLPAFALGFNALLWLARTALTPVAMQRAGVLAGWSVALIAPLALLAIALRLRLASRDALLLVAAASLGLAGLCAGA